jgi:phospholipid/cholesterol/gamma-HCH transport system substrate-binding protein
MPSFRKNLMVGIVVLGALIVLGWMILKFGERPVKWFTPPKMALHFEASRADGLSDGSPVFYRGVSVGTVIAVKRSPQDATKVLIDAQVDQDPPLPGNVRGVIRSQLVGGGSSLSLELTEAQPAGQLAADQTLTADFLGVDILPQEFAQLAIELRTTSEELRRAHVIEDLDKTLVTIREQVLKAGQVVDSLQKVVGDDKMREDLRQSIANFRATTEGASKVTASLQKASDSASANIDQISKQVGDRMQQIAKLLESFQSISAKIDKGEGTAGLLVNDPKLYQSLVDSSKELNATITDLRRLVEQWEQEGVSFKLH